MTVTAAGPVRRTTVDGVPVLWVDTAGPLHAELLFGVGRADETFRTTGITHLVEHLVMRSLGDLDHDANAGVSLLTTGFEVSGPPAVVVDHLRRLCGAIARLDLDPIEAERRVLLAEEETHPASSVPAWPLSLRYGCRGPGLAFQRQLGVYLVSPDAVRDWAQRWLHRDNAALVLTGPPPPGLTLPLPDGPAPQHSMPPPLPHPTPAWIEQVIDGLIVAMIGPDTAETTAALAILRDRLTRALRHDAGLVYDVDTEVERLPGDLAAIGIGLGIGGRPEHAPALRDTFLAVIDELCASGPTDAELERNRRRCLAEVDDEHDTLQWRAYEEARTLLVGTAAGWPRIERTLAGVAAEDVRAAIVALRASMTLGVPLDGGVASLPRRHAPHPWPAGGRVFRRALFGAYLPRGAQLMIGRSSVTLQIPQECPETVAFADVVGVGSEDGPGGDRDPILVIHGVDGTALIVRAKDWRGGHEALELLRAALPPEAVYTTPEPLRVIVSD
ncbi:insulinase family protein [Pseudonocardia sp. Ae505_Ps2]|uniref:insulinase family protein n=1 Tax=Pseudonocardia sp. Ae505_Ps2 TaxID=1885034 RepID=UPI00094EC728|nr:insulinase family protein [Pseudonocardia sp. Ae505_Ps2]